MDTELKTRIHPWKLYLQTIKDSLSVILKTRLWFDCSAVITPGVQILPEFFGVNIAPSADCRVDDYVIARLHELGLRHVRMDFTYASIDGDAERLLKKVLAAGF